MEQSLGAVAALIDRCVRSRVRYLRFWGVEKLGVLFTTIIETIIFFILGSIAVCYLSLSLVHLLEIWLGIVWSYAIMGIVVLLIAGVIYMLRHRLILDPITRLLAGMLFTQEDQELVDNSVNNEEDDGE